MIARGRRNPVKSPSVRDARSPPLLRCSAQNDPRTGLMFRNDRVSSFLADEGAPAIETCHGAADLVSARWQLLFEADPASRPWAFASYAGPSLPMKRRRPNPEGLALRAAAEEGGDGRSSPALRGCNRRVVRRHGQGRTSSARSTRAVNPDAWAGGRARRGGTRHSPKRAEQLG